MSSINFLLNQPTVNLSYERQVHWLLQLTDWLKLPATLDRSQIEEEKIYNVRLKFLLLVLSRNPEWKINFTATVSSLLSKISSVSFFTEIGMTTKAGFLQDFIRRLEEKILPRGAVSDDLSTLLSEVFDDVKGSSILSIDDAVLAELVGFFENEKELSDQLKRSLSSALLIMSSHILAGIYALCSELGLNTIEAAQLVELQLHGAIVRLAQADSPIPFAPAQAERIIQLIELCEQSRLQIYLHLESQGVKVDLVYALETQRRRIIRLRNLCEMAFAEVGNKVPLKKFISQLVVDLYHQQSLKSFFSENLSLLTQKIVQQNSHVGEHYVTFNKIEFRRMFRSAMGGGAITSLTVFLKSAISALPLTGFVKGFIESINYSGSFLWIQIMGWTLATKQPSATAPFLAQVLKRSTAESQRSVIALLRTQFIAVMGNLSLVFPICFGVSWIFVYFKAPLLTVEHAEGYFHSSSVLGASPLYAAFTGILLFLASLIAGWFENWTLINRLPQRILSNQTFFRVFGLKTTRKISQFFNENSNALAGNISLGLLLGLAPQYLKFLGLPIEVRHITLATGSFAFSLPVLLQGAINYFDLIASIVGLLVIGVLNISVSFTCALILAAVSSRVKISALWNLVRWGLKFIFTKPWLLFVPEDKED